MTVDDLIAKLMTFPSDARIEFYRETYKTPHGIYAIDIEIDYFRVSDKENTFLGEIEL